MRIFFFFGCSKPEKFKSYHNKKKLLQLVLFLIPNQATLYNKKTAASQLLLWSVHSLLSR